MLADLEKLIRIPMEPETQLESFFLPMLADLGKFNRILMEPKRPLVVINFYLYIFGKNLCLQKKELYL